MISEEKIISVVLGKKKKTFEKHLPKQESCFPKYSQKVLRCTSKKKERKISSSKEKPGMYRILFNSLTCNYYDLKSKNNHKHEVLTWLQNVSINTQNTKTQP